jgi:hypothetical protein
MKRNYTEAHLTVTILGIIAVLAIIGASITMSGVYPGSGPICAAINLLFVLGSWTFFILPQWNLIFKWTVQLLLSSLLTNHAFYDLGALLCSLGVSDA